MFNRLRRSSQQASAPEQTAGAEDEEFSVEPAQQEQTYDAVPTTAYGNQQSGAEEANLPPISQEMQQVLSYLQRYTARNVNVPVLLKPFMPEFVPSVMVVDEFIKVPRPDGKPDGLGLRVLDEPAVNSSDPVMLRMQLKAAAKDGTVGNPASNCMGTIQDPEKQGQRITEWLDSMSDMEKSKAPSEVHYTKAFPTLAVLTEQWPHELEPAMSKAILPNGSLDVDTLGMCKIVCALLDAPFYEDKPVESLHLLFRVAIASRVESKFEFCTCGLDIAVKERTNSPHIIHMCFKVKNKRQKGYDPQKKALLVGICYFGTDKALKGCIRDIELVRSVLINGYNFDPKNVLMLRDDAKDYRLRPTKENIYAGMKWLTTGAQRGSSLVFHFSGHGIRAPPKTGNGPPVTALLPVDYKAAGVIRSERINQLLVNPISYGVQLFSIIDACHSGKMMALPYNCRRSAFRLSWKDTYPELPLDKWTGTAGGRVVQISASEEGQKAIDTAKHSGLAQGAATYAFITALQQSKGKIKWGRLLIEMHKILDAGDRFGFRPTTGKWGDMATKMAYAAGYRGQTPVISANEMFDLEDYMRL